MANTIARCTGIDGTGRTKEASRLGSRSASGEANTWKTFTKCFINSDGSGYVEVKRDGNVLHRFDFGSENEPEPPADAEVLHTDAMGESVPSAMVRRVIG